MSKQISLSPDDATELNFQFVEDTMRACRKLRTLFDNRTRSIGLTLSRARALVQLAERDLMSQTELAALLDIEGPTLVRLLDGLQRQGLAERREQGRDRRVKQVALTAKGRALAAEIQEISAAIRYELLQQMDRAELQRATTLMRELNARLDQLAGDSPSADEH